MGKAFPTSSASRLPFLTGEANICLFAFVLCQIVTPRSRCICASEYESIDLPLSVVRLVHDARYCECGGAP